MPPEIKKENNGNSWWKQITFRDICYIISLFILAVLFIANTNSRLSALENCSQNGSDKLSNHSERLTILETNSRNIETCLEDLKRGQIEFSRKLDRLLEK